MKYFLAAILFVAACSKGDKAGSTASSAETEVAAEHVATIDVDGLDHLLAAGTCATFDANSQATRERQGVIPGATLLAGYDSYPLSILPRDKAETLVFYCANEQCGASHKAAARAVVAGYSNVKVLPAGIAGWAKAGKPVDRILAISYRDDLDAAHARGEALERAVVVLERIGGLFLVESLRVGPA